MRTLMLSALSALLAIAVFALQTTPWSWLPMLAATVFSTLLCLNFSGRYFTLFAGIFIAMSAFGLLLNWLDPASGLTAKMLFYVGGLNLCWVAPWLPVSILKKTNSIAQ